MQGLVEIRGSCLSLGLDLGEPHLILLDDEFAVVFDLVLRHLVLRDTRRNDIPTHARDPSLYLIMGKGFLKQLAHVHAQESKRL